MPPVIQLRGGKRAFIFFSKSSGWNQSWESVISSEVLCLLIENNWSFFNTDSTLSIINLKVKNKKSKIKLKSKKFLFLNCTFNFLLLTFDLALGNISNT